MIWFTNATSLNNKIDELRLQCEIYKPDVICVTETWFKAEPDVNIISYNIFRSDRKTHGGGVCIFVKQCINQFETNNLQLNNNFIEQIWTCICFKNNKMLIGCIYRPPDISHEYNNYVLLSINAAKMSIYQKEYSDLIITGDFNYNTIDWSDNNCPFSATDNESQTNKFIECLEDCFLFQCVCNVKQGHHLLKCCYLMNDYKFSTEHKKSIRLYQNENYELFSCHFNNVDWENGFKSKSINEMYDLFLYHYNYATNLFIPRINYQNRRNRNKWITPELKHKIRTKNNIWLANKRNGWNEESTKVQYNKLKTRIKNDIKNNIKQFESTLASKFKSNPKLLYKYINEKKSVKTHIRALEIDNGEIINDQFAIATELNKYFHSVYINDNCANIIEFHNIPSNLLLNTVLITQNDVQTRLQALDKSKSVGFDFVHPYVLKECSSSISYPLYLIFKKSMETGTLPDMWKKANVMPLFKKGSKLKASNYRPVSLTSIPCKLLERIIADSNRKLRVVLGKSVTDWVNVLSCVPQGSLLGPLLFLVLINDLPENFINECRLYADDNKIIAPISSQNDSQLFQNDINKLDEWSTK
ncbi:uncharacterized protein LOC124818279 [Hydra vulgaris]|uniref:uncharacterized protein LOC124818279 n=1 Tax=Hydra vulgaris TaxID=6087 RepID=UPI0032EA0D38